MGPSKPRAAWAVWTSLAFIAATYALFVLTDSETAINLAKEDGFFESLSALCFAGSSVLFGFCWKKNKSAGRPALFYALLAGLFLFIAGEECSWGQRFFGYSTPALVAQYNVQNEMNLHNFEIFNRTDAAGHEKPRWAHLLNFDFLFSFFWFVFCFLIPAGDRLKPGLFRARGFPIAPLSIGVLFPAYYAMTKVLEWTVLNQRQELMRPHAELKECVFSFLFLMLAFHFFRSDESVSS